MQLFLLEKVKSLLLIYVIVICSSQIHAQESNFKNKKADSAEVNALNDLYWSKRNSDPKQAKLYLDKAIAVAKELNYREGIATAYRYYGDHYASQGDYDRALLLINKGQSIFEEVGNKKGVVLCLNTLGQVRMNMGDHGKALEFYIQTEQLNEELNDLSGVSKAQHNIGNIHFKQRQYKTALKYFELSLKTKESLNDSSGMVITMNGIGAVLLARKKFEEALDIQLKTLSIVKQLGDLHEEAVLLNNIGVSYYYLQNTDSTRYYYLNSLKVSYELGEKKDVSEKLGNLGILELYAGDGIKAREYFDSSLIISQKVGATFLTSKAYEGLAEANRLLGNHKVAYDWFVKFHLLNDSLVGERVKQNINKLQVKYESGKKDLRIVKLERDEASANATADKREFLLILVGLSAFVIITMLILYLGWKKTKEKLRVGQLEQKALRSQMNPHFIFNSLNSIQRLYIEGKEDLANDYMADFSNLLRRILENSSLDKISLKEEIIATTLYLDLEQMRTDHLFNYRIEVDPTIDQLNNFVPPLIIQPYVENAIWHGILPNNERGNIRIRISRAGENELECIITDDGIGIKQSKKQKNLTSAESKGMNITADRLGGDNYAIVSELESGGTKVKLRIKKIK